MATRPRQAYTQLQDGASTQFVAPTCRTEMPVLMRELTGAITLLRMSDRKQYGLLLWRTPTNAWRSAASGVNI